MKNYYFFKKQSTPFIAVLLFITSCLISYKVRAQSPGGVNHNLRLWLKSNTGVVGTSNVLSWNDQSTHGFHFNAINSGTTPTLISEGYNYNPLLTFDGINDMMEHVGNDILPNAIQNDSTGNHSIYTVMHTPTGYANSIIFVQEGMWNTVCPALMGNGGCQSQIGGFHTTTGNNTNVGVFGLQVTVGGHIQLSKNGLFGNSSTTPTPNGTLNNRTTIGGRDQSTFMPMASNFAEVIIYDHNTSTGTERKRIESYLAMKYGITLDTATAYRLSNDSIVWDGVANWPYHYDVIGIVRDDSSGLAQRQSHSMDDSLRIYVGGLQNSNALNNTMITNNLSSIMIGHDMGRLRGTGLMNHPLGIYERLERVWQIENTNFTNAFSMEILWDSVASFDINDIRFLVDDDGDFSNATVYDQTHVNISIGSNGSIIISGIDNSILAVDSFAFVTIGSASSQTPLPIFIQSFTAVPKGKSVHLQWQAQIDNKLERFEVEHSTDGHKFSTVGSILVSKDRYHFDHNRPVNGFNYYRLKCIDANEKQFYSEVRNVSFEGLVHTQTVRPNPANTKIIVESTGSILTNQLKLYSITGAVLTNVKKTQINSNEVSIDISDIPDGIYIIKGPDATLRLIKQQ